MMCDVMPSISEDADQRDSMCSDGDIENGCYDDGCRMMDDTMMLDEKEELLESLREAQDNMAATQAAMQRLERERDSLYARLFTNQPVECAMLSKELTEMHERLNERDDEICELKAERNNTRLLLEHLECLVARHERSLRMTVVKRQAQSPGGVSSEVEVLKALKSLFEHHKALDEKLRDRLRVSTDRISQLEEELALTNQELFQMREREMRVRNTSGEDLSKVFNELAADGQLMDGANNVAFDDKRASDVDLSRSQIAVLRTRISELETALDNSRKECGKASELNAKLQFDLQESNAQKGDQEERITTLEKRYLVAQRELTAVEDSNDKLKTELALHVAELKTSDAKLAKLQTSLTQTEEKLARSSSAPGTFTDKQTEQPIGSLTARIKVLETRLEEQSTELQRSRQREKLNEEHNVRLSATVDKLQSEASERLQLHLKERIKVLEEKNHLTLELEVVRKALDATRNERDKLSAELDRCSHQIFLLQEQQLHMGGRVPTSAASGDIQAAEWRLSPSHLDDMLAHNFDPDTGVPLGDNTPDLLASGGRSAHIHPDAQTLAMMLQEQLDVINNEIRLIQEEKDSAELRAEELECQVGGVGGTAASGDLENASARWPSHQSFSQLSPPSSDLPSMPSPSLHPRNTAQKYLVGSASMPSQPLYPYCSSSPHISASVSLNSVQSPLSMSSQLAQSVSRDDGIGLSMTMQSYESSSSSTSRSGQVPQSASAIISDYGAQAQYSMQPMASGIQTLTRSGGLVAGSGNGGGGDSSNSTPSSHSSTNSSQDSLHKPIPKKKSGGLKTSIGRIFSTKKEKPNKDTPNRGYHTLPASTKNGPVVEADFLPPDNLPLGAMGTPSEFDRRKKKKVPTATLR